ncbi:MAG TPA: methylaspartate ammonia-lyase [Acholeplasmataceae bacterium]|nr:methylaspartate ammonia-lyase [Acholeplasmataceae bacterium]
MKIVDVILSKSYTGFYFDDQKAIKEGATLDGFRYVGEPKTPGFQSIRIPGEAISIQLVLEDGLVATGDCAAVQYSGAGGRDPLFLADDFIPFIEKELVPLLKGEDVSNFKSLAEKYDKLEINGKRLHTAIRYGITQALLKATSLVKRKTMAEVVREEYGITDTKYEEVAVFSQSGDDRYLNADKMIIKQVDVLPHALINHVETKLGKNGEILREYIKYLKNRILDIRASEDYNPVIQVDVYGTIGMIFDNDSRKIVDYLKELASVASPFKLRVEGPVDAGSREATMQSLKEITALIDAENVGVEIVADEWCNTLEDVKYFADNKAGHILQIKTPDLGGVNNVVEAIMYCNEKGIGAYCGGTCNETSISCEVTTNIAIGAKASQILAKPGMGVDEAIMIVRNEMNRVLALANRR